MFYNIENYLYDKEHAMTDEQLIKCMKALSDPKRLEIFKMLLDGKLCACKILDKFEMTQPTLSYHMKLLSDADLVNVEKDWKWCHYTANKTTLSSLVEYFDEIKCKTVEA